MNKSLLALCLVVGGCVPSLGGDDCETPEDCDPGEVCVASVCVAEHAGEVDLGGRGDTGGGGTIVPDDGGVKDGAMLPDAGPDAARDGSLGDGRVMPGRDALPPPLPDAAPDGGGCTAQPEICDGADNDCDGEVDEGSNGLELTLPCYEGMPQETARVGICRIGQVACVGGVGGACEDQVTPAPESCNGQDDDCDGALDEGIAIACYVGPAGTMGIGVCTAGARSCAAGVLGPCAGAVVPRTEICDGADNDCDGETDEVAGGCAGCEPGTEQVCYSGAPGTAGEGACVAGTQLCRADGSGFGACEGEVVPVAEACNQVDDDCDGQTDESLPLDQPCRVGVGACVAEGQTVCRAGEAGWAIECDAQAGAAVPEVCDDADNDCDGRVDEMLGLGEACAVGLGPCRRDGERVCSPAGAVVCGARPGSPEAEVCNARDDDCDGETDEGELTVPCYSGPRGTAGVGACRSGERACGGEVCEGEVLPGAEVCNGVDDDCDGELDNRPGEACECEPGTRVECYDGDGDEVGVGVCRAGESECRADHTFGACMGATTPGAEVCNGVDDDCDGATDEDLPRVGGGCFEGQGACLSNGTMVCDGEAGAVVCDALAGEPVDESCNGVDDDCDGWLDEELDGAGDDCAVGVGACFAEGIRRCVPAVGAVVCGAEAGAPEDEACDGVDNDCDGAIDEGVLNACLVCGEVPAEFCNEADDDCDGAIDERVANACGECGPEPSEVCNGVDDDCDDAVDEGVSNRCGACGPEPPEVCDGHDNDCDDAVDEEVANACGGCGPVPPEICNGQDDDCDDETDEGVLNACGHCGLMPVELCNGEDDDCDNEVDEGLLNRCGLCGPLPNEVCDGEDNDCDDETDEGVQNACGECGPVPEEVCDGEDNDCDDETDEGVQNACGACGEVPAEICNNEDDDCDDAVDEGVDGSACEVDGLGQCAVGVLFCRNGEPACVPVFEPADELCDGLDNDCDGEVDEDDIDDPLCAWPHASGVCANGDCQDVACEPRWFDIDDNLFNGCERGCGPAQSPPRTGRDGEGFDIALDGEGQPGVASFVDNELSFATDDLHVGIEVPGGGTSFLAIDLTWVRGWWVVAAQFDLVPADEGGQATTRVVVYSINEITGDVFELGLLRDNAGPPTAVGQTGAVRNPNLAVAFVAEDAPATRRVYYVELAPGLAGFTVPNRYSNELDWRPGRVGLFWGTSARPSLVAAASTGLPNQTVLRYRERPFSADGDNVTASALVPNLVQPQDLSAARGPGGAVYVLRHGNGLVHGAIDLGGPLQAPSFGARQLLAGNYGSAQVDSTALGYLSYQPATFGAVNNPRASVLLINPDGTLLGGPLHLDARASFGAAGAGPWAAWRGANYGIVHADTGCN